MRGWAQFSHVVGGALAGVALGYGIAGESVGAYVLFGIAGALFFPWVVARTRLDRDSK